ncbi:hypothetical protein FCM35_KLT01778 [Carex littledalei]|uniref:Uncharacterized protein n=1 Tax=Carex littledalei TaxID=544730 RepID=A0A833VBB3_9POAL|nr:hypothetical protein FCM35_KLT01778 [Carex littledalei]
MIPGFNRSISLPMNTRSKARAAYHVRSVSLPCRSHPLISNLEEQIRAVRSLPASSDSSLAWIEAGLSQIELLHSALNDFLSLTETKNVLQRGTASTERLLDNLLYLVDSYGSLLSAIATLKQQLFEVQSAFRRCDSNLLTSSLKSQRKTEKELSRIASSLRVSNKYSPLEPASDATEVEIFGLLKEAIVATSAASVVLFNRVVAVSTIASTAAVSSASSRIGPFAKKVSKEEREMVAFKKLEELEECVKIFESGTNALIAQLVQLGAKSDPVRSLSSPLLSSPSENPKPASPLPLQRPSLSLAKPSPLPLQHRSSLQRPLSRQRNWAGTDWYSKPARPVPVQEQHSPASKNQKRESLNIYPRETSLESVAGEASGMRSGLAVSDFSREREESKGRDWGEQGSGLGRATVLERDRRGFRERERVAGEALEREGALGLSLGEEKRSDWVLEI